MTLSDTLVEHDVGPEVSPYASAVCHIAFGGGRDLAIPRDLLRGTGKLNDLSNTAKGNQLRLEHISYEVGHILVHYLYTRSYQTLSTGSTGTPELLDLSLQTYVAASNYGIAGLTELAKERVLQFASVSPAMSVLQATTKACKLLEGDDAWVLAFVTSQVRLLFDDPEQLDRKAFLDCFGTTKSANTILVLAMIEYCTSKDVKQTANDSSLPAAEPEADEWAASEEPTAPEPEPEAEEPVPAPRPDPIDFHERESTMSPMPADSEPDAEPFEERLYSPATGSLELESLDVKAPEAPTNGHSTADVNGAGGESAQQDSETKLGKKDKKKKNKKKKTRDDGPPNGVEVEARVLGGAPLNGHV